MNASTRKQQSSDECHAEEIGADELMELSDEDLRCKRRTREGGVIKIHKAPGKEELRRGTKRSSHGCPMRTLRSKMRNLGRYTTARVAGEARQDKTTDGNGAG